MPEYDAYEVHQHDAYNYSVTLVDTTSGARFTTNPVVCGRQAHHLATRGFQRPMRFLGVTTMVRGERVATTFPDQCDVTDPLHVHTHRAPLPTL